MSSGPTPGGEGAAPGSGLARLTENEQKLVAKLLSDPTYFPIEFRTWLKQFIEGSGIIITASQIQGGTGTNVATGLPPGVVIPVAGSSAVPVDTLPCDGTTRVRADYPLLFTAIGTTWGAGDGSTTFNLPDLRDRALYGAGGRVGVAQTDGVAFGSRGGAEHHHDYGQTSNPNGSHSHGGGTGGESGHTHGLPGQTGNGFGFTRTGSGFLYLEPTGSAQTGGSSGHSHGISSDGSHTHFVSGPTGGGFGLMPSFAGVIYVISIGTTA